MARKPKNANKPKSNPAALQITAAAGKVEEVTARILSEPEVRAAAIIQKFEGDSLDINSLAAELRNQTAAIKSGDISRAEAMLGAQAHTLDALFSVLARRAHSNMMAGYFDASTGYMKLALKAQAQTVRTIEALGELTSPKTVTFVAQANISGGHQQVNNGRLARARKNQIEQTKLSGGGSNGLLPDTRTQSYAGATNQAMEAVGEIYRASDTQGQSNSEPERF